MVDSSLNNKRIAKNTFFLYFRMIFVLIVSIYTTRAVLNILGVEDFGIYNVVCGFVSMFTFLNTSMSNGIQRFYNYEVGSNGLDGMTKVYQASLCIQVILAAIIFILIEAIGVWYVNNKMVIPNDRIFAANIIFQLSTISLMLVILQVPYSAAILAHECMDYYALVSVIDVILKLLIVLVLPYIPSDRLIIYGCFHLSVTLLNFAMYFIYAKTKFVEIRFERLFHRDLFRSIFTFSGWNMLSMFAWMTQGQGVNMIINLFFGPIINAARGVSGQIQSAIQGFCENLVIAFRPQLVQSYAQGNISRTKSMMYSLSKIMFIMFFMLSTPVIFEIDYILHLWLGNNVPDYTGIFTVLILISMYPRNFSMAFAQVVHATGKLGMYQVCTSLVILLVLPISYFVLKIGADVASVYWVNLIICILMYVVCILMLKRQFDFSILDYLKKVILPCGITSAIVILFPYLITTHMVPSFIRLCVTTIVCVVATIVVSYIVILDANEKQVILNFIKK